ncbi:MAG: CRISPR-associated endonuclease Cas1 [Anaerolineae bacterium]
MATLYITEQGARLERHYQTLEVTKHDERLMRVPLRRVTSVVLVGNVGVTTPTMHTLLANGVSLALVSRQGRLIGWLRSAKHPNLALRHRQYARATDPAFCLEIARQIVYGKLRNSLALARRLVRAHNIDPAALPRLESGIADTLAAPDLDTLRGIEGSLAKVYFAVLRAALPSEMTFSRRTRRPPTDPVNALLSFGYTLLTANLFTAAEIVGLDPYDGFFHADKYGRPALALDLVEEFRPIIVDSVILTLVNNRRLKPGDFYRREGRGVWLSRRGLRRFLRAYSERLHTTIFHPDADRALSYQKVFELQARRLRKVVEGEKPVYEPFLVR